MAGSGAKLGGRTNQGEALCIWIVLAASIREHASVAVAEHF